jgi:predicted RNA-binding protein YlxR (DUF448 family)
MRVIGAIITIIGSILLCGGSTGLLAGDPAFLILWMPGALLMIAGLLILNSTKSRKTKEKTSLPINVPVCPVCHIPMRLVVGTSEEYQGKELYICPNHKECNSWAPVHEAARSTLLCPVCHIPMQVAIDISGEHQGRGLYVCPNHEQCSQWFPMNQNTRK